MIQQFYRTQSKQNEINAHRVEFGKQETFYFHALMWKICSSIYFLNIVVKMQVEIRSGNTKKKKMENEKPFFIWENTMRISIDFKFTYFNNGRFTEH